MAVGALKSTFSTPSSSATVSVYALRPSEPPRYPSREELVAKLKQSFTVSFINVSYVESKLLTKCLYVTGSVFRHKRTARILQRASCGSCDNRIRHPGFELAMGGSAGPARLQLATCNHAPDGTRWGAVETWGLQPVIRRSWISGPFDLLGLRASQAAGIVLVRQTPS